MRRTEATVQRPPTRASATPRPKPSQERGTTGRTSSVASSHLVRRQDHEAGIRRVREVGSLYRGTVSVLEPLGPLVVRARLLVMHLAEPLSRHGKPCAEPGEAHLQTGAQGQRRFPERAVKDSLMRLRLWPIITRYRRPGVGRRRHSAEITWSILARSCHDDSERRRWLGESLSTRVAHRNGQFTSTRRAFTNVVRRSDQAAHLRMFQSDPTLARGASTSCSRRLPEGEPSVIRDTPAISDLLQLTRARRRDVVREVRQAARIRLRNGPRLPIRRVKAARGRGMWKLVVTRNAQSSRIYQETVWPN